MPKLIKMITIITTAALAISLAGCGSKEGLVIENIPEPTPEIITTPEPTPTQTPEPTSTPTPEPTPRNNNDLPVNAPDANGLVWLIKPVFEYEKIRYCNLPYCDLLAYTDITNTLSVETILAEKACDGMVYICDGHGGVWDDYSFDEKKGLFIIHTSYEGGADLSFYTPEEFITGRYDIHGNFDNILGQNYAELFYPIRKIDPEKIIIRDDFGPHTGFAFGGEGKKYNLYEQEKPKEADYDLTGAYTGKFALAYGNTFLTDFIYDYEPSIFSYKSDEIIGLKLDGKWGILDKNGNTVIQFILEEFEFIDDATAFAKYNGKYGILDLRALNSD